MDRTAWIVVTLCVAGLFGWGWWSTEQTKKQAIALEAQRAAHQASQVALEAAKPAETAAAASPDAAAGTPSAAAAPAVAPREIVMENAGIRVHLTNLGGGIARAELLDHQRSLKPGDGYIVINESASQPIGALSQGPKNVDTTAWQVTEESPTAVAFTLTTPEKLAITKRYTLPGPDKEIHLLGLEITVRNTAEQPAQTGKRYLYLGSGTPLHPDEWPRQTGFYFFDGDSGDVFYKGVDHFQGRKFLGIGSDPKLHDEFTVGLTRWAGVNDQFFTTLLRPLEPYAATMWASRFPIVIRGHEAASQKKQLHAVEAALSLPDLTLAPGDQRTLAYELYLGPKEYERLHSLGEKRALVMKYDDTPIFGWMFGWAIRPLASGLIQVLVAIKDWVGSYGIAIILVTILIRTIIWPVYAKSTRTMKRMSKLTPMMNELREKYKDDQQKQSEEMMKLYRDYGVNPLGGCLPMFIQLPVFLAFYGMLWRAAELRHEGFLWVDDLSMPDTLFMIPGLGIPFNLLPLVMAGTTFIQMAMTPKTGDKTQQMVFKIMPFFFLVLCYNFASALSLYWTTQNIFSIFQTWLMNRLPEPELKKKPRSGGKTLMERLQEQAKAREQGAAGAAALPGGNRTKLAGEKGDRHTKSKRKGR